MTAPINCVIDALRQAGCNPQQSDDEWSARCPAHDDNHPSLSIGVGDDLRVLLCCHAGCEISVVLEALELKPNDLFACTNGKAPRRSEKRHRPKGKKPSTKAKAKTPRREIVATYPYIDEAGKLLFEVVRYSDKSFHQRRPNGKGGWIWDLKGVRRILYHLPEILIVSAESFIFVAEGEKDVDRLRSMGLIATGNPGGAGKWSKVDHTPLHGHHIVVIADNDAPGRKHARDVCQSLYKTAASVRLLGLSGLPQKGDVSDWLDADPVDHDADELVRLAETTPEWIPNTDDANDGEYDDSGEKNNKDKSQSQYLVEIIEAEGVELFHGSDSDSKAYATITTDQCALTMPVKSRQFRRWLAREYYSRTSGAVNSNAMTDALGVIEGKAIFDGPEREIYVRLAEHDGAFYLDLGGPEYTYVEIDARGWRIVSSCDAPVRFIRKAGMRAIPEPVRGGNIELLRPFLNVDDDQFVLVLAFLAACLSPRGPHPALVLNGEAGSAKTTSARVIRNLIDPNKAMVRAAPRDTRDLVIAASNSWLVSFDNLSKIRPELSDSLCRLSTGGGFSTRELYSDDAEVIFDARRPVILNGIENVVVRGDLRDRSISLTLQPIADEDRVDERDFWRRFEQARPAILGAMLDAVSCGLKRIESVKLDAMPRMADFARWAVACSPALGLGDGEIFLRAYQEDREAGRMATLDFEVVASPIIELMKSQRDWSGTFGDLLRDLEDIDRGDDQTRRHAGWPKSPRGLSGIMRRIAPDLRAVGVFIDFPDHHGRGVRGRIVTIIYRQVGVRPSTSEQSSTFGADDSPMLITDGRLENGDVRTPSTPGSDCGSENYDSADVDGVDDRVSQYGDAPLEDDHGDDILDEIPY